MCVSQYQVIDWCSRVFKCNIIEKKIALYIITKPSRSIEVVGDELLITLNFIVAPIVFGVSLFVLTLLVMVRFPRLQ